jgi:hypothetical protein
MNKIRLIVFASALHDAASVMDSRKTLFDGLGKMAEVEMALADNPAAWEAGDVEAEDVSAVCFIATGGTEEIFERHFDDVLRVCCGAMLRPIMILSDGLHNSFAASFEICTFLHRRGIQGILVNAPLCPDADFFSSFGKALDDPSSATGQNEVVTSAGTAYYPEDVLKYYSGRKIGLIGGESAWLIASHIDRDAVEASFGCKFVDVPIKELEMNYFEIRQTGTASMMRGYREMCGVLSGNDGRFGKARSEEDLCDALNMYLALKRMCDKYRLDTLTIKCFDLLGPCRTTACLGLALLNDAGTVSGCEGDIPTLWTMMYAQATAGGKGMAFMANPSSSDTGECTVDFAHCTVPIAMTESFSLPSHFESSIGIGVAGILPLGRYELLKIGGELLDSMFRVEGEVIENTHVVERCRTQLRFKFDSRIDFDKFMSNRLGNHVILCRL